MKDRRKISSLLIYCACIIALVIVVFPLLYIAQYDYPSADDWSFGVYGYQALQRGEGIWGVIRATMQSVAHQYMNWEGRFSAVFLGSLQPGIWGEKYYGMVAWLMLGAIIFGELYLFYSLFENAEDKGVKWFSIPIVIPALILQILYCPAPEESFYWYTGAVNYTFVYGLSLMLLGVFAKLARKEYSVGKRVGMTIIAIVLSILVGGNNFATSLSCFLILFLLTVLFAIWNKPAFKRTWFLVVIVLGALLLSIFAPGNTSRINSNFNGETGNAIEAIISSLIRSFTNIYSWLTNGKVFLMILFVLPFIWVAVKRMTYQFKLPGIFTLLTFGAYASQITATLYVDGTTGGGRMAAILFYSCYVWLIANLCYWMGWVSKKENKGKHLLNKLEAVWEKYSLIYCALIGVLLVGIIYTADLRQLTSYRAYRDWRQGWAKQYAAEWDARLEVLHDASIKNVEFQPLSPAASPELLIYTDLQDEKGYVWVNYACAEYYEKDSVMVIPPQN
ncbi:MAG: hypothetical protein J6A94_11530 [Lachnospiraceae bacterium]|nr:hypothetical protein [Lachnospiraceae bacterium]